MKKGKMILRHLSSIVFVSMFLIISTLFVFMPKQGEMAGALSYLGKINSLHIKEITSDLRLEYLYPISDKEGLEVKSYDFEIVNNSIEQNYMVVFSTGTSIDSLDNEAIRYVVKKDDSQYSDVLTLNEDGVIIEDFISENTTSTFSFKFWISDADDIELNNKTIEPTLILNSIK